MDMVCKAVYLPLEVLLYNCSLNHGAPSQVVPGMSLPQRMNKKYTNDLCSSSSLSLRLLGQSFMDMIWVLSLARPNARLSLTNSTPLPMRRRF